MLARDVMTETPRFCYSGWTCRAAAALMKEVRCGFLPVVESGTDNKVVGVVTDRDLCMFVVADDRQPSAAWVHQCMRRNPYVVDADDDVELVVTRMIRARARRLPVMDREGKLVGVVSMSDLVRTRAITAQQAANALADLTSIAMPIMAKAKSAAGGK